MTPQSYYFNMEVKFKPLEIIDVGAEAAQCCEQWFNQTLARVNDCVVRLGVLCGEFHFHHHEVEDEFFYVVEGCLLIDFAERTVELHPKQGLTVPRGVLHRTRAPRRTVVLMIEGAGVRPQGD